MLRKNPGNNVTITNPQSKKRGKQNVTLVEEMVVFVNKSLLAVACVKFDCLEVLLPIVLQLLYVHYYNKYITLTTELQKYTLTREKLEKNDHITKLSKNKVKLGAMCALKEDKE